MLTADRQARPDQIGRFERLQVEHFSRADEAKFLWQTRNAYLSRTERELLQRVPVKAEDRLLEVGCGEGANLELLEPAPAIAVGVDLSRAKVCWAARRPARARFACGDATRLPFRDACFDVILCRDVLHHVADKSMVIGELLRVCRPLGRIVIIEPNGRSPVMWLLGLLVPAERELMRHCLGRLYPLLDHYQVMQPEVGWAQPFPFGRVLFHCKWGFPRLSSWLAGTVLGGERLAGKLTPCDRWAYLILKARKRGPALSGDVALAREQSQ
ncbi:MAG: class I SAM-dependent methyltransferase [Nitrospirae bacterium]|nr:class I SAM-dependent methyltransferase [Nitrospirota bacterium]